MTCIIGIKQNNKVWLGADSAGVCGDFIGTRNDKKVFKRGPFIIGGTSSFRMIQLLNYNLDAKPQDKTSIKNDLEYVSTYFIDSVRRCLKDGGFTTINNGQETSGSFLLGYKNNLYFVDSDHQVGIPTNNYDSVGCGRDSALGAMFILSKSKLNPVDKIRYALTASEHYNAFVRRPFHILSHDESHTIT